MRVPSSLPIYVAAAELTNYKNEKRNSLKHPRRKPHINHSLLSLLNGGGNSKAYKRKASSLKAFDFDFDLPSPLSLPSIAKRGAIRQGRRIEFC